MIGASFIEPLETRIAPAGVTDLGALNGTNGFRIDGIDEGDKAGFSVSGIGDVNGDGFDDVIVGAHDADALGDSNSGEAYVVFGQAGGFPANIDLATLSAVAGFRLDGVDQDDATGLSVSGAGDVNADGIDDLIIGAPFAAAGSGRSYVVFGSVGLIGPSIDLSALTGFNGFRIDGVAVDDGAGYSVSAAGDIDGDGIDDVIIGAPGADPGGVSNAGSSYVVFGKDTDLDNNGTVDNPFQPALGLAALNGLNGFRIDGIVASEISGFAVSGAGDVNDDGVGDVIIGAPNEVFAPGVTYVVYGKRTDTDGNGTVDDPFSASINLSALNGANGSRFDGIDAQGNIGAAVAAAGDVNDDDFDDVIIGTSQLGKSFVVFGKPGGLGTALDLSTLDGTTGFRIDPVALGNGTGSAVSGAGDVNGDTFDDLIVGGAQGKRNAGQGYVIFGRSGAFEPALALSELTEAAGFRLDGAGGAERAGLSVSGAGDVNGDGFNDLILGAPYADPGGDSSAGGAYVVFGSGAVQINARTVFFTEPDGDEVMIKVNKGTLTTGDVVFEKVAGGVLLKKLDLTNDPRFAGAKIRVFAEIAPVQPLQLLANVGIPGVEIGEIDATGVDLNQLVVEGDVTKATIGSSSPTKRAIKVFKVNSLGVGQASFPDLTPVVSIKGAIGKVVVVEDVTDIDVTVDRGLGQLVVGGTITDSDFDIGSALSLIKVGEAMTGSSVRTTQGLGKLIVTEALGDSEFDIGTSLNSVKALAGIDDSTFKVAQVLGSLSVTGNLSDTAVNAGAVLKKVKVVGAVSDTELTAGGTLLPKNASKAKAIGSINIVGDLERSQILAGYDLTGAAMNADVIIGGVSITGRFVESSIVAGVRSTDGTFGAGSDALIADGNDVISKIASVTLRGEVLGSAGNATDGFGIVAQQIGKLKIGTTSVTLNKGASNDPPTLLGSTDDVRVDEV